MGKVKETVIAWPNVNQEDLYESRTTLNFPIPRSSSNDSLMLDLERELFSPILLTEEAGFMDKSEQYMESLDNSTETLLSSPILDLTNLSSEQVSQTLSQSDSLPTGNFLSDASNLTHIFPSTPSNFSQQIGSFHPPHAYPPNPFSMVLPQQPNSFLNSPLSPLSSGGFIFNQGYTNLPPQTPFVTPFVPLQIGSAPFTKTVTPVSSEIASRQEKLDKFRQKRSKRNYNRTGDSVRRERAQGRSRDELGHFMPLQASTADLIVVKTKLEKSQEESKLLQSRLLLMEQEMALLRQKAEQAKVSHDVVMKELAAQQNMNNSLLLENRLLWTSVPSHEVFCTIKQQNGSNISKTPSPYLNVKPFEQKIDLSLAVHDLTNTDSRILEAARAEEVEYEKRWDALDFTPGGAC